MVSGRRRYFGSGSYPEPKFQTVDEYLTSKHDPITRIFDKGEVRDIGAKCGLSSEEVRGALKRLGFKLIERPTGVKEWKLPTQKHLRRDEMMRKPIDKTVQQPDAEIAPLEEPLANEAAIQPEASEAIPPEIEAKLVDEIAQPASETVQPPEAKPVTMKAKLTGPKPLFCCYKTGGGRSPPCSLKLPSEILDESGLRANCEVELTATPGQVIIKKIGDGPGMQVYTGSSKTEPPAMSVLGQLMKLGKEIDAEQKRRRDGGEWEEEEFIEEKPVEV